MANEIKTTRYPWADAPHWARSAATHLTGEAFWYGDPIAEPPSKAYPNGCWFFKTEKIEGQFDPTDWQNSLEINPKFTNQAPQPSPDFTDWNAQMLGEMTSMVAEQVQARVSDALYREHLRAQFAGQAMAALLPIFKLSETPEKVAKMALSYSDALIAALYPSSKAKAEK